jgi:hypothetical protein
MQNRNWQRGEFDVAGFAGQELPAHRNAASANVSWKAELYARRGLSISTVVRSNFAHVRRFRLVKFVPPGQIAPVRLGIRECRVEINYKNLGRKEWISVPFWPSLWRWLPVF